VLATHLPLLERGSAARPGRSLTMLSQLHYTKAHLQTGLQHTGTLGLGAIIFGDLIGKLDVLWTLRPLHPAQLAFFRHSQVRLI